MKILRSFVYLWVILFLSWRYGVFACLLYKRTPKWCKFTILAGVKKNHCPKKKLHNSNIAINIMLGQNLATLLQRLGPAFIKLGQLLSTRSDIIGQDVAEGLGILRDRLPAFSSKTAIKMIEEHLGGSYSDFFAALETEAVAAASIAQVHKAYLHDDKKKYGDMAGKAVAIKILRPDVSKRMYKDIALMEMLSLWVRVLFPFSSKRLKPKEVIYILRESLKMELDLRFEAAAADEMRENMQNDDGIYIPKILWELSDSEVMVMEWVNGIPAHNIAALIEQGHNLELLAGNAAKLFFLQVFRDGFFHADLHAGNVLIDNRGTIVLLDFGITGRLDYQMRIYLAQMFHGFLTGNYRKTAQAHFDAGFVPKHKSLEHFAQACRSIGAPIMGKPLNQISAAKLLAQLFKISEEFEMQTQPQLLLLQKTLVMIEGMGRDLAPSMNIWQMVEPVIRDWARDNVSSYARIKNTIFDLFALLEQSPDILRFIYEILESKAKK